MKTRLAAIAAVLVVGLAVVASAQDTTTLLSYFLNDLRSGTLGVLQTFTKVTATNTGLATTSTDGAVLTNTTAATAGATVQMSPRLRLRGNAWDTAASETVDFFVENLPATAATPTGTFKLGYSLNGAAASYPMQVTSAGSLVLGGQAQVAATQFYTWNGRNAIGASADKLYQFDDNAAATGAELNVGTPTLGTCTGGSLTSGSHNFSGEVTGNTSGSCIVNFGTPNFTNAPFCFINDETTLTAVRISARSASSITITGAVSADAFQYFCIGRIGT